MIRHSIISAPALLLASAVMIAGCGGGGYDGPSGPGNSGGSTGPGPIGATITIANGRVNPTAVSIAVGQSVMFVNNDSRSRTMSSDPHPNHTDCPAINATGILQPGQSRPTGALNVARVCGFHDHDDPDNGNLKGQIEVR